MQVASNHTHSTESRTKRIETAPPPPQLGSCPRQQPPSPMCIHHRCMTTMPPHPPLLGPSLGANTCNKYASHEMHIWLGILLHLCFGVHGRLFWLAHGDNNRFHMMVCRGIVGTTLPQDFLVGTPRTLFPCIDPRQFPSTNPSPAHPATSHAISQALFPSTLPSKFPSTLPGLPTHPLFQAPISPAHPATSQALSPLPPPITFSKQWTPSLFQVVC